MNRIPQPNTESDESPSIDALETLVVPLWRSRAWVVGSLALGAAIGIFAGAIQPNVYESSGKLLVRYGAREQGTAEDRVNAGQPTSPVGARELVANEQHLISDPQVYSHVVRKVGAPTLLLPYDPVANEPADTPLATRWLHEFQRWWFSAAPSGEDVQHVPDDCDRCQQVARESLMKKMRVQVEPGSTVISVSYAATSPALATEVVAAFLDAAQEQHVKVFAAAPSLGFLDEQLQSAVKDATSADEALSQHRIECNVFDIPLQRQRLIGEIHDLESKTTEDAARLAELRSLESSLAASLPAGALSEDNPSQRAPVSDSELAFLTQRLHDARARLAGIEGEGLTAVAADMERRAAQAQIDQLASDLARTRALSIRDRLDEVRSNAAELTEGSKQRTSRLSTLRRDLAHLEECSPKTAELEKRAQQARDRLAKFNEARDRAGVLSMLDSLNMTNLRPLQPASVPLTKSGPKRGKFLLIGALLGLVIGLPIALLRARFDQRVRRPSELERLCGRPLVGVIPKRPLVPAATVTLFARGSSQS
jgi:uncharacterized protein involved in exopolysaccharide biosynthesis